MTDQESKPFASPVCYAGEGEASYMGYLNDHELHEFMNCLEEGERSLLQMLEAHLARVADPKRHQILQTIRARHLANIAAFVEI